MRARRSLSLALVATLCCASARAQEVAPAEHVIQWVHDTGYASNQGGERSVVLSYAVEVPGATWLRLAFREVTLAGDPEAGDGAILRVTALRDGGVQELNAVHVDQWQRTTCYFNGDCVLIDVVAHPRTGSNRFVLETVYAGTPPTGVDTQCGPEDNRVLSNDPRAGRLFGGGCTAWLIDDCNHCFLTAGHCGTSGRVVQFNVPLSGPSGSVVNPSPDDQYAVDGSSVQSQNGGIGNDWKYFGCFPNPNTNLTPFQKQQASYVIALPPPFSPTQTIRITGYGVDSSPPQHNQVQQTHAGPWFQFDGTMLKYQADTTGGNSGSAVVWDNANLAIGIHTHAGCNFELTDANHGTALNHPGLQAALANPLGVCTPSGSATGSSTIYCTAKVNSLGCTPQIGFTGVPSVSGGPGSYTIGATQVINNVTGLLFYGWHQAATPFQGGTMCTTSPTIRTPVQTSGAVGPPSCNGSFSFDMGAWIQNPANFLHCGATIYAQFWYRDLQSVPFPSGFTNAVKVKVGP